MNEKPPWPIAELGQAIRHRKVFITIDDFAEYKRCRVQLHAKGIVLRDIISGAGIQTKQQQVCRAGDFLVAEIDAKVGGFGVAPAELDGAIVSSHYFLYEIEESRLDRRFLDYYIRTRAFRDQVEAQGSTNYAAIRPQHVLGYTIPLPPLAEQQRIVARIDALAARIEEAKGLRATATTQIDTMLHSAVSAFPLPDETWTTVGAVAAQPAESIRSGPFGSQLTHDEFVDSGVMAIGTRDVQVNRFEHKSGWFITHEKFRQFARYQVFPGDILVTIVGASIGRFCVVPKDTPVAITTKHVVAITPDLCKINPHYATYFLNYCSTCTKSVFNQTEGSAQPSLNLSKVKAIRLPVPPLLQQHRIITYLDELRAKVQAAKRLQTETQAELDALLPSVLDRAFRGEL